MTVVLFKLCSQNSVKSIQSIINTVLFCFVFLLQRISFDCNGAHKHTHTRARRIQHTHMFAMQKSQEDESYLQVAVNVH